MRAVLGECLAGDADDGLVVAARIGAHGPRRCGGFDAHFSSHGSIHRPLLTKRRLSPYCRRTRGDSLRISTLAQRDQEHHSMSAASPTDIAPPTTRLTGRTLLGLIVVFITQLMLIVDASIVNVALPHIQAELGFTATNLSWVVTAYALAFAGLILLSGRIGSMIGARRALIIGTVVFIAASALGGFAVNPEMLVAARVLQGIGAALAAPSTLVLLMANTVPGP